MRLTVNYKIRDILNNEQLITAERDITVDDLRLATRAMVKMDSDYCIFLKDSRGYFIRMYYDSFNDEENRILTVDFCIEGTVIDDVRGSKKIKRADGYKLIKEILEEGLDSYFCEEG